MYLTHPDLNKYWVIDIETDSLTPSIIWCIVCQNIGTGAREVFVNHEVGSYTRLLSGFSDWVRSLVSPSWVGHNIVSFDGPVCTSFFDCGISVDNSVDTLVLSTLYEPNMQGGHSLEEWGQRLGYHKIDFHDYSALTEDMVRYCIRDVEVTAKLFLALTKRMVEKGYSEKSCKIEHHIRDLINEQQRNGFCFNTKKAHALLSELREKQTTLEGTIRELFPPTLERQRTYKYRSKADGTPYVSYQKHLERYPRVERDGPEYHVYDWVTFNLGSPQQRVQKLLSLGWEPIQFTKAGNPKADEESIVAFAEVSGVPEVAALAEWLVVYGRANSIQTWINAVQPDGCIHGKVWSCGANSRRMTHTDPNTANIPSTEARYGHECRALWEARPGRVLVGGDADSLEMRMFLDALGAPAELVSLYLGGDPHQGNADALSVALGVVVTRRTAKTAYYAFLYGAQDNRLGNTVLPGGGKRVGAIVREVLFANTPGLKELTEGIQAEYRRTDGRILLIDGGYNRCGSPHSALNFKLQGNGAIVMKLAAILLRDEIRQAKLDALFVGNIHDELQLDCLPAHAEQVGKLFQFSIKLAGELLKFKLPITGSYKIGASWADTH